MFHGSIVALVTPMLADGSVDYDSLRQLVDWHIEQGTDAIVVLGTSGEAPTITVDERRQIIKTTIEQVKKQLPIIIGTGTNSTRSTIELTQQAMELGADACLVVAPYYNKPEQEGLYQHFHAVANTVAIPQILYNHLGRTGSDILPVTVQRLAKLPNIIGIKETTSVERCRELVALFGDQLDVYTGVDDFTKEVVLAGAKGGISVVANIVPKLYCSLCEAAAKNDVARANEIEKSLLPLYKAMMLEGNPIPVKWGVHHLGLIAEGIRLPLTWLKNECRETVAQAIEQIK